MIAALTDDAFSGVNDVTRYRLDGADRLQTHLRALTARADLTREAYVTAVDPSVGHYNVHKLACDDPDPVASA